MPNITLIDPIAFEIWLLYELWNLIGKGCFHSYKAKNLQTIFTFLESISTCQNQVDSSILTWFIVNSRILQSDWIGAYLTMSNLHFTNHLFHFLNLHLYAKN